MWTKSRSLYGTAKQIHLMTRLEKVQMQVPSKEHYHPHLSHGQDEFKLSYVSSRTFLDVVQILVFS